MRQDVKSNKHTESYSEVFRKMDQVEGDNQKFVQIKTFLNFYHDRLSLYQPPKTPVLD